MRRKSLTRFEKRWARQIFNGIIPPGTHPQVPEGAGDLGADETLNALFRHASFMGALGHRLALWLTFFLPPLIVLRPRTFGGLSIEQRDQYLRKLYRSRFYLARQLVFVLKLVASTGYIEHPRVRSALEVDGSPRVRTPRSPALRIADASGRAAMAVDEGDPE